MSTRWSTIPFPMESSSRQFIKKCHKDDNVQAFADDVSLLSIGKIKYGIIKKARNTMKMILEWCKENGLQISVLKTKIVFWSKSNTKEHPKSITVDGNEFKLSKSVKYLGVIIDNKLNWNEHINEIVLKCKKTFFAVKKSIGKKWGLTPKQMMWIYIKQLLYQKSHTAL